MITVYGRATSLNVRAVIWTLAELVAGYYARLCERPACAQHVMVPYDILRQMRR